MRTATLMRAPFLIRALAVACVLAASPALAGWHFTTVDAPASPYMLGTVLDDINNDGVAVGFFVTIDPSDLSAVVYHGFSVYADGSNFTEYTRPGAQLGFSGINDHSTIVGVSSTGAGDGVAVVRSADGAYTDLDLVGGGLASVYSEATGINNDGTIVGWFADSLVDDIQSVSHGFIDIGGVFTQYDVPVEWGTGTQLISMNTSGTFTGSYIDAVSGGRTGFVYDAVTGFQSLGGDCGCGPDSEANDVNEAGHFVANLLLADPYSPTGYAAFGVLFTDQPLPVFKPDADFTATEGLNDNGQVVGFYADESGIHAYVASYVPEPATWALLIAGFGLTGVALRRRRSVAA